MQGGESAEDLGVAREDLLIANSRKIVSNTSLPAAETSASWNTAARIVAPCKTGSAVVIAWEKDESSPSSWTTNCDGGPLMFNAPMAMSTTNLGVILDGDFNVATSYGNDVNVVGVPGHDGQFAIVSLMATSGGTDMNDVLLASSEDGGRSFTARTVVNDTPGVDRPVVAVDPGATDGTMYVAWEQNESLRFRKVTLGTDGSTTLDPVQVVSPSNSLGAFTLAVQHGSPNTVWLAYSNTIGAHNPGDCGNPSQAPVTWWAGSTTNDGVSWAWQGSPIDTDPYWIWCASDQTNLGYGNDTRPELLYAPGLNELAVAYTKLDISDHTLRVFVATFTPGGTGEWTVQKPANQASSADHFRATFASFPTSSTSQAFGLSWLNADASGNVTAWMTTSTTGALSWAQPAQISATSWTFANALSGDYNGMAALGDGSNEFWDTWIARGPTHDDAVTAGWTMP